MLEFTIDVKKVTFEFGTGDKEIVIYLCIKQGILEEVKDIMDYVRKEHFDKVTFFNPLADKNATRHCILTIREVNHISQQFIRSVDFKNAAIANRVQELLNL